MTPSVRGRRSTVEGAGGELGPHITDLPRFVQKRAYDKGLAANARVVVVTKGEGWLYSRPLIEGTRIDARDMAASAAHYGVEDTARWYAITPEQVEAAVEWRKQHPRWRPGK